MTWDGTFPTVYAGFIPDADDFTLMVDALRFLAAPPRVQIRQGTLQSVPNNAWTAITMDAEDCDLDPNGTSTHHDLVTNNSRITAIYAGRYLLGGGVAFAANATARRGVRYAVNGTAVQSSETLVPATAANPEVIPARGIFVSLNVGDYVELQGFQESGGALNTALGTGGSSLTALWVASS